MLRVSITDLQSALPPPGPWYGRLARFALKGQGVTAAELSLAFVDDQAMQALNREFLGHDYPTDIVTFPLSEPGEPLAGELVISTEFALRSARRYRWPAELEVGLYIVHGILHLCGHDDREAGPARAMRRLQTRILADFRAAHGDPPARSNGRRRRAASTNATERTGRARRQAR